MSAAPKWPLPGRVVIRARYGETAKEENGLSVTPVTPASHDTAGSVSSTSASAHGSDDKAPITPEALLKLVLDCLDDGKAEDILSIDLVGKSSFADVMVIASGRSNRQVAALADRLLREAKNHQLGRAAVEGLPQADWVLIDFGEIVVHLFKPEVREFYNLEKMWGEPVAASPRSAEH